MRSERDAMNEWQPIETAPLKTEVLVYVTRATGLWVNAINNTGIQWWARGIGAVRPTHWMPLPEPPRDVCPFCAAGDGPHTLSHEGKP